LARVKGRFLLTLKRRGGKSGVKEDSVSKNQGLTAEEKRKEIGGPSYGFGERSTSSIAGQGG